MSGTHPQDEHAHEAREAQRPALVIVMGVSGCGKSTIGQQLSDDLGAPFVDGDDLHPKQNVDKMSAGEALNDDDRWPWLHKIREEAARVTSEESVNYHHFKRANGQEMSSALRRPTVLIACSALKRSYRELLRGRSGGDDVAREHHGVQTYFVYLRGDKDLLMERMHHRKGHFMKESMLQSQLDTLEEPTPDEDPYGGVITIDISQSREDVRARTAEAVRQHVGL